MSQGKFSCFEHQRIAGQKRERFAKANVAGRFAAPHAVVVHAGQIVVNESTGMKHLQPQRHRQRCTPFGSRTFRPQQGKAPASAFCRPR
jgi:hypothetical protein